MEISPEATPLLSIPAGFPDIEFPAGNEFTPERWELGKTLFFDKRLSRDQTVSCASCHLPQFAFSDTSRFSRGVGFASGSRNSPSLANVAYHPYFTREGGVPTLEMQVLVPIQEHNEFDFNILEIADRLRQDSAIAALSYKAYNREPDYYVIPRALATFERSLISGTSNYDKFTNGNQMILTDMETAGMHLFFSEKTNCFSCHSGFNFTDYSFQNNGLYAEYEDPGRFRLTNNETDIALFKVPSLRNAEITAPYMHDGSIASLEEVIEHYNNGGKNHPHKSSLVRPLNLTQAEKDALIAFIKTLTDHQFLENENFHQ